MFSWYFNNMYRNRTCFVPFCKTGYKKNTSKLSMFKAPKDEKLRTIWAEKIGRSDRILREQDVVCERHFNECDLIKFLIINGVSKY